jgi:hypothetical protein
MPMLPYRDTHTKFGGVIRIFPDGSSQVIQRDFGLTTEPECSEAAHRQMYRWFCEQHGILYDPTLFQNQP